MDFDKINFTPITKASYDDSYYELRMKFESSKKIIDDFVSDLDSLSLVKQAADEMIERLKGGGKIISCGNGGSMCDAMHFASELTGKFINRRKSIPAIAIADPSYLSCVANDYGIDDMFSRFVSSVGISKDVLLAISTSGYSRNVMNAINIAIAKNMRIVALTGNDGGLIGTTSGIIEIRVPFKGPAGPIQEMHIKIIHVLVSLIEKGLGYE
jgi:D-sedoheptulose 7-phosphate isomerase